jgi:ribonuclease Z
MPRIIILGASNAIPDEKHANTHLLLVGKLRTVLIDCADSPLLRFQRVGVDYNLLSDLVLTHFHPDHVSGVPQLLTNMWLMGRSRPLNIYGLDHTLDRIENLMGLYGWSEWPNFFPVTFHRLPEQEMVPVLECSDFRILAAPVRHIIPTIGLRIEFPGSKKVLAYSSDTEPCPQVLRLAGGADVLIHEMSGPLPGHSSAAQAGREAAQAGAGALYLIHYPTGQFAREDPVAEAQAEFKGPVMMAEDFMTLSFD